MTWRTRVMLLAAVLLGIASISAAQLTGTFTNWLNHPVIAYRVTPTSDPVALLNRRIRTGEITCTIRLWQRPHVHVGGRYALPPGEVQVTRLFETTLADVTPELARQSGFSSVVELLKVAKHGPGRRVFVIEFRYVGPPRHRNSNRNVKTSRN